MNGFMNEFNVNIKVPTSILLLFADDSTSSCKNMFMKVTMALGVQHTIRAVARMLTVMAPRNGEALGEEVLEVVVV